MDRPGFDKAIENVRDLYEAPRGAALLAVALAGDQAEVAFLGNTTSLRRLLLAGLNYLAEDARQMAAGCPCARCSQNLDIIERAHAVLQETIPADRN